MWYVHCLVNGFVGLLVALGSAYICEIWILGRERSSKRLYLFSSVVGICFGILCAFEFTQTSISLLTIFFGFVLFMGATIDMKYLILPDEGAILILISGLVRLWLLEESIVGAIIKVVMLLMVGCLLWGLSKQSFGLGDVKWLAASMCWVPIHLLWLVLYISFVSGTLFVVLRYGYKKLGLFTGCVTIDVQKQASIKNKQLPFAPFLCSAIFLVYLWGELISGWYTRNFL